MSFQQPENEANLRKELAIACKVLYLSGAAGDGLGGHLSVRLDEQHILIKPRPISWLFVDPKDFILISFAGERVGGPASERTQVREWPIHAQIYAMHSSVRCVLHSHPTASTLMAALAIAVEPLDQNCAALTDQLPVLDNEAVSISTTELGNQIAGALGSKHALLIKNHGSVVTGPDIPSVCDLASRLEKVAETMLRAASISRLPLMSKESKTAVLRAREAAKPAAGRTQTDERWQMLQSYYLGNSRP